MARSNLELQKSVERAIEDQNQELINQLSSVLRWLRGQEMMSAREAEQRISEVMTMLRDSK